MLFRSPSNHLSLGLLARLLPCRLSKVSFFTGFSSGILIICPVQRSFDILIVLIMSGRLIEHKEEIKVIFHRFMDLLKSSILNNNNNNNKYNNNIII